MFDERGDVPAGHLEGPPAVDLTLQERSVRAVEEIRSAADALEPQAAAWKQALRDVYSHLFGEQISTVDDAMSLDLVDSYRRLYDEMLRLSTLLDPDISRRDPEVSE